MLRMNIKNIGAERRYPIMKQRQKSLLEQLFDNELFPPGGIDSNNPDYFEASCRIEKESDYLMSRLNDEDRERLDELISIVGERESYAVYNHFAFGFRFGVRLMWETLTGKI